MHGTYVEKKAKYFFFHNFQHLKNLVTLLQNLRTPQSFDVLKQRKMAHKIKILKF